MLNYWKSMSLKDKLESKAFLCVILCMLAGGLMMYFDEHYVKSGFFGLSILIAGLGLYYCHLAIKEENATENWWTEEYAKRHGL